jgi:hypothetical protein
MAEPTLIEVFGAGATQTATTITILKSDLTGLTASANNTAEGIFSAIVKKASNNLTSANYGTNSDQSITIAAGFDSISYRTISNIQTAYLQNQVTINFAKVQSSPGITPDSY